jgi:hypothetical protein
MTKSLRRAKQDRTVEALFGAREGRPCPTGTALLRSFADARPADFAFLQLPDLANPENPAFAGIPEWEDFATHYTACELCHA